MANVASSTATGAAAGSAFGPYGTLIGAGIGAVGGIASSLIGNSANKANTKEQNRFYEYMWNKTNEYNTPANQMARLKAAGLNPMIALQNVDTGNANSVQSADIASFDSASLAQGFQNAGSMVYNDALSSAQTRQLQAQTQGLDLENAFNSAIASMRVQKFIEESKKYRLDNEYQLGLNTIMNGTMQSQIDQIRRNALISQQQLIKEHINTNSASIDLSLKRAFGWQTSEANLNLLRGNYTNALASAEAAIRNARSNEKLSDAQIDYWSKNVALMTLQTNSQIAVNSSVIGLNNQKTKTEYQNTSYGVWNNKEMSWKVSVLASQAKLDLKALNSTLGGAGYVFNNYSPVRIPSIGGSFGIK